MSTPDVSVVLISYNDAQRVGRALASVQRQTLRNLEIIVVDDASTDDTASVVRAVAETDSRVRYIRLDENSGGCSAPRNRGMAEARAPWVMFCDSDDEYERHACKNLLLAAERLDADVVCGAAVRVDVATGKKERWRPELHDDIRSAAGLREFPELLYDTISVNKIYRRSLLERHGLTFPEGLLFEDQLFTLQAMTLADRIAVIPEDVYYWYVDRKADMKSITQSRAEVRNVESRLEINRRIDAFLGQLDDPVLRRTKDVKFLRHDLHLYLISILDADDDTARELAARLSEYAATTNLDAAWQVRPMTRVALYHLLIGDLECLRSAMRFLRWGSIVDAPVEEREGRQVWACSHAESGPVVAGRAAGEWLDTTELDLLGIPFSQRRYAHHVTSATSTSGGLALSGTTVDYAGDLTDASITVQLVSSRGWVAAQAPAAWTARDARSLRWECLGPWEAVNAHVLDRDDKGNIAVVLDRDGVRNTTNVRGSAESLACPAVTYPAGGGSIELTSLDYSGLGWRASDDVGATVHESPGRRMRPLAVRLGSLLPRANVVLVDANGGRAPQGRVRAIADALRSEEFGLEQVWVDRSDTLVAPPGVSTVRHGTLRYSWLAARALVRVSDVGADPSSFRSGLNVVTGRAPRLARTGLDDPSVLVDKAAVRQVRTRARACQLALASGPADEQALRSSWEYEGPVALIGTPELPSHPEHLDVRTDRPLVVYAPAARDNGQTLDFDADAWAAELGTRCYLVICTPPRGSLDVPNRLRSAIRTTSSDAAAFVGAADLVIGDYGPAVPWAIAAERPLLAYAPDERLFVQRQHGLYADVRSLAPLARTMADLVAHVQQWLADPRNQLTYAHARTEYRERWCGTVSGDEAAHAAARVIVDAARSASGASR